MFCVYYFCNVFIAAQFMEFDLDNSGDIGMIKHVLVVVVIIVCLFHPPRRPSWPCSCISWFVCMIAQKVICELS